MNKYNWPLKRDLTRKEIKNLNKQLAELEVDIKLTKDNWIALDLKYKPVIYCNKHDKGILREIYLDESSYDDLWIDRVIIRR